MTKDDLVIMASEAGVLQVPPEKVIKKGRLQPGKMFLVDTVEGRIVADKEIKKRLAGRQNYAEWLKENQITLEQLPEPPRVHGSNHDTILCRQRARYDPVTRPMQTGDPSLYGALVEMVRPLEGIEPAAIGND